MVSLHDTVSSTRHAAPQRVVVVGTSGSGKTTLAREIALRLSLPHVELDAVHWGPNWAEPPVELFRQRTEEALRGGRWVADGNYGKVRDLVWGRAEMLVWLDYALPLVMGRLVLRTLRRGFTQEELWNGNRERLRDMLTRESLLLWALQSHRRHRREYPARGRGMAGWAGVRGGSTVRRDQPAFSPSGSGADCTRRRSSGKSTGLARWTAKPASRDRRRSSSCAYPEMAIKRAVAVSGRRHSSSATS
jgi:adenylate kinase family enzyme